MQRLGQLARGVLLLRQQPLGEFGEFELVTRQGLLRAHALGHVAQDGGEQFLATHGDVRDGGLQLQLGAVGAHALDAAEAHGPGAGGRLGKALHQRQVLTAVLGGQQRVQRLADHGLGLAAEDARGRRVEQADAPVQVHADDGVAGGVDQRRQHLALLAQAHLAQALHGEVAHLGQQADGFAVGAEHLGESPLAPDVAAVAAQQVGLEGPRPLPGDHRRTDGMARAVGRVLVAKDLVHVAALGLGRAPAEHALGGVVPEQHAKVHVHQVHGRRQVLQHGLQAAGVVQHLGQGLLAARAAAALHRQPAHLLGDDAQHRAGRGVRLRAQALGHHVDHLVEGPREPAGEPEPAQADQQHREAAPHQHVALQLAHGRQRLAQRLPGHHLPVGAQRQQGAVDHVAHQQDGVAVFRLEHARCPRGRAQQIQPLRRRQHGPLAQQALTVHVGQFQLQAAAGLGRAQHVFADAVVEAGVQVRGQHAGRGARGVQIGHGDVGEFRGHRPVQRGQGLAQGHGRVQAAEPGALAAFEEHGPRRNGDAFEQAVAGGEHLAFGVRGPDPHVAAVALAQPVHLRAPVRGRGQLLRQQRQQVHLGGGAGERAREAVGVDGRRLLHALPGAALEFVAHDTLHRPHHQCQQQQGHRRGQQRQPELYRAFAVSRHAGVSSSPAPPASLTVI